MGNAPVDIDMDLPAWHVTMKAEITFAAAQVSPVSSRTPTALSRKPSLTQDLSQFR